MFAEQKWSEKSDPAGIVHVLKAEFFQLFDRELVRCREDDVVELLATYAAVDQYNCLRRLLIAFHKSSRDLDMMKAWLRAVWSVTG